MELLKSDLPKLKTAYFKAVKEQKDEFTFQGILLITNFVKYLLQAHTLLPS